MDLSFSPEGEAFREEVQTFLREKLPRRLSEKVKTGKRLTMIDHQLGDEDHPLERSIAFGCAAA
ncbi:MAG: hypothetical protein R3E04_01340 [Sphingobium sp.]